MKKLLVLAMVAIVAAGAFGQTRQQSKQIKALDKEIKKTRKEISQLAEDSLKIYEANISSQDVYQIIMDTSRLWTAADSVSQVIAGNISQLVKNNSELIYVRNEIGRKKEKIHDLENARDAIFSEYVTAEVPKEISHREAKRRVRGNVVRREELVIKKIEANLSAVDPSGLTAANGGYKVIVANDYVLPVTFDIVSTNGGDRQTVIVEAHKRLDVYLVPGAYRVSAKKGGSQAASDNLFTIDGRIHVFKSETCFAFIYMPRF